MITLPKKERGGNGLGSHETTHIFRDPPKSIHTRKKERVGPESVNYMTRENPDRYSDSIQKYARGVNPMIGVNFATGGSKIMSMKTQPQGHNAYKVNKKFVPPIIRQEDILPLSRQKRDLTSVTSKQKSPFLFKQSVVEQKIDYEPIKKTIHINPYFQRGSGKGQNQFQGNVVLNVKRQHHSLQSSVVAPNKTYNPKINQDWDLVKKTGVGVHHARRSAPLIQQSHQDSALIDKGIVIRPSISVSTNMGVKSTIQVTDLDIGQVTREIKDKTLRSYLPQTFNVAFYNPNTHEYSEIKLSENIKEKIVADINKSAPIFIQGSSDVGSIKITENMKEKVQADSSKSAPIRVQGSSDVGSIKITENMKEKVQADSSKSAPIRVQGSSDMGVIKITENMKEKVQADSSKSAPIRVQGSSDMGVIKIKDYNWAVHRTNAGNSTLFIESVERPDVFLKNDPIIVSVSSQIDANLKLNADVNAPILEGNRPVISVGSMPNTLNVSDNMNRDFMLPESLRVGGFSNQGIDPSKYIKKNMNPIGLNRTLEKKINLKNGINNFNNI
jgi:hypothetical protein